MTHLAAACLAARLVYVTISKLKSSVIASPRINKSVAAHDTQQATLVRPVASLLNDTGCRSFERQQRERLSNVWLRTGKGGWRGGG